MSDDLAKFTMADAEGVEIIQCLRCSHRVEGVRPIACPAFPGGIPEAILTNAHDHRKAYPDDHGIRFEPIDATMDDDQPA